MTAAIVLLAVGAAMFGFGHWGRTHSADLARGESTDERRTRQERKVRRGGVMWQLSAAFPLLLAIVAAVHGL